MLKHTQAEGKRTGIEIDMNTGTGWPFGGPEVSIEEAASKAIFQTYEIEGGQEIVQDINVADKKQQPYSVLSGSTALSKAARRVIRIHSSTTPTRYIRQTGQKIFWISSPAGEDISWKNTFRSSWTKAVRKSAAASYPITGKRFPIYCWKTLPVNGRTGHTRTEASPAIRHTDRLPT